MHIDKPIIGRRDAQLAGLKRFYTGKPCERGHVADRFTSNGSCVECQNLKVPNKRQGPKGRNVVWPTRGFVFNVEPPPTVEESEATFAALQAYGWLDEIVRRFRDGRAKVADFLAPPSPAEIARLDAELRRAIALQDATRARVAAAAPQSVKSGGRVDREEPEFEGDTPTLRSPDADEPSKL